MDKSLPPRVQWTLAAAVFLLAGLTCSGAEIETSVASPDQSAVFEKIRALAGDWEGSFQWSGARTDAGKMQATYYATAGGTAIVENLSVGRKPIMTSVYHLDSGTLRMTHYCMAGNQPRLKAAHVDNGTRTVRFTLVDVTNLAAPKAPYVHQVEIQFVDESHIVLTFGFGAGDALSYERIDLRRTRQVSD